MPAEHTRDASDPILWAPGSRLLVHVSRLPSPEAWAREAAELGVSFDEPPPVLSPGEHELAVNDAATSARLVLAVEPFSGEPSPGEIEDEAELAVLRRARWSISLELPNDAPDRLPTALAVSLAAAGDGVCYHAGMERAVFGAATRTMMNKLRWYAEHETEPDLATIPSSHPAASIPELVELVTSSLGTGLDRCELASFLQELTLRHFADVESSADTEVERRAAWTNLYLAHLHVWLQAQPATREVTTSPNWTALVARVTALLAAP